MCCAKAERLNIKGAALLNEADWPLSGDDEAGGPCARVGEQRSEAELLDGDTWLGFGLG